jgi:hypothetical protein
MQKSVFGLIVLISILLIAAAVFSNQGEFITHLVEFAEKEVEKLS